MCLLYQHIIKNHIIMKILLDIEKLKGRLDYKGPIRIKLKLGEHLYLWTELSYYNQGGYPFMQKHMVTLPDESDQSYIEISIIADNGVSLGNITVFLLKFKQFKKIQIKGDSQVFKLYYSLREVADNSQEGQSLPRRTSMVQEEPPNMNEQSSKLEIFRLGILMFNFVQRLDPLVVVYNSLLAFLTWKNPLKTLIFGIALTLVLYYTKTFIFLGGVSLFFGKEMVFRKLAKIHKYQDTHKRLIVPKENAYLIQQIMDTYCNIYENVSNFLFNDDKATLINLINFVCKTCLLLFVILALLETEFTAILSLWLILLLCSPFKRQIIHFMKPCLSFLIGEYDKIYDKITVGITNMLGSSLKINDLEVSRQFYYYYYERWWVLKGWCDETKKYSDEKYEAIIVPREKAPDGWAWVEQWKIQFEGEVDSLGYQYSNDLISDFRPNIGIPTRRRRKWTRTCVKHRQAFIS